jgi:hypothetical protein
MNFAAATRRILKLRTEKPFFPSRSLSRIRHRSVVRKFLPPEIRTGIFRVAFFKEAETSLKFQA